MNHVVYLLWKGVGVCLLWAFSTAVTINYASAQAGGSAGTFDFQVITLEHTDYDQVWGTGSAEAESILTSSMDFGNTFWYFGQKAKAQGNASGDPLFTSGFDAHAYIKNEWSFVKARGASASQVAVNERYQWSYNTDGTLFGSASSGVSFNGSSAIGSTGNTGWGSDTYVLVSGSFGFTRSTGAAAGGYAMQNATAAGYAHGIYDFDMKAISQIP